MSKKEPSKERKDCLFFVKFFGLSNDEGKSVQFLGGIGVAPDDVLARVTSGVVRFAIEPILLRFLRHRFGRTERPGRHSDWVFFGELRAFRFEGAVRAAKPIHCWERDRVSDLDNVRQFGRMRRYVVASVVKRQLG